MKTKKNMLAIFIACGSIASVSAQTNVSVGGAVYSVSTEVGTFNNLSATLQATPWWTNPTLARDIAIGYVDAGAYPEGSDFPYQGTWGEFYGSALAAFNDGTPFNAYTALYLNTGARAVGDLTFNYADSYIWLVAALSGPSPTDTLESFRLNSRGLRNQFNLQSAHIARGLSYDCSIFDINSMCVAIAGDHTSGNDVDVSTGALIIAHKPTQQFRFGGYIDQSFGLSTSGGLTARKSKPGYGLFGVWTQNDDASGIQVRGAVNFAQVDIETTREAVGTAEAGFGKSNIKSDGVHLEVSRLFVVNPQWSVRPYVGYRETTNQRAGYAETSGASAPLLFGSLKQRTETLIAGATFAHPVSTQTTMLLTAGVEQSLKNHVDTYTATNSDIGDIDSLDMSINTRKTQPMISFAVNHNINNTERLGFTLTHLKGKFESGNKTSFFVQYSKGF